MYSVSLLVWFVEFVTAAGTEDWAGRFDPFVPLALTTTAILNIIIIAVIATAIEIL